MSSDDEKLRRVHEMGAPHGINYIRETQWGEAVLQLTGGARDHVLEAGGSGTVKQSIRGAGTGAALALSEILA